jgi:hypothetical protein
MEWEETSKELQRLIERRDALAKHVVGQLNESSADFNEWLEIKTRIVSLTFKLGWEIRQDHFALER